MICIRLVAVIRRVDATRLHVFYEFLVQVCAYGPIDPSAVLELDPVRQDVVLPNCDGDVLADTRWRSVPAVVWRTFLEEYICGVGVVASMVYTVFCICAVYSDPRCKTAFEATILDNVDGGCWGATRRCCCR